MHRLLATTCALVATCALAQNSNPAKPVAWAKEPDAVFGLKLGAPLAPDLRTCGSQERTTVAMCMSPEGSPTGDEILVKGFPVSVFRSGLVSLKDDRVGGLMINGSRDDYQGASRRGLRPSLLALRGSRSVGRA
jgi:hypothetical protein